jgi:putative nucleotidyltransferase with HDIG domain
MLANSPFYGLQRQVTTINDAISVLGLQSVRNLAITGALVAGLSGQAGGTQRFMGFWRHTTGAAVCAQALAARLRLNRGQAYVCGLMHDIGRLVLMTWFPDPYAEVMAFRQGQDCQIHRAEQEVLGLDHAHIGAELARRWRFPDLMAEAIAQHHLPPADGVSDMGLLVHVADALAHALDFSQDTDDLVPQIAESTWQRLGLDQPTLVAVLGEADAQFELACGVLAD